MKRETTDFTGKMRRELEREQPESEFLLWLLPATAVLLMVLFAILAMG